MITEQLLRAIAPRGTHHAMHAAALEAARLRSSVNSPARLAAFLGQVVVETGGLVSMAENLGYRTPAVLLRNFRAVRDLADARRLIELGPEAIANRVYANRLGNGDEASGDGWRYRGSGYKQLTGRSNYRNFGRLLRLCLQGHVEQARRPIDAAQIAFAFWDAQQCSPLADQADIGRITACINGPAKLGLADRRLATEQALALLV
jgi:putative chitinase